MISTNLKAPFFLTQALLPLLADGGRILNVSTGLARFTDPGYAAYAATKGAIEVLTRYQAKELAERRIRVNVVVPGAIATDFGGGMVRDNPTSQRADSRTDHPRPRRHRRRHRRRSPGDPRRQLRLGQRGTHRIVRGPEPLELGCCTDVCVRRLARR